MEMYEQQFTNNNWTIANWHKYNLMIKAEGVCCHNFDMKTYVKDGKIVRWN